MKVLFLTIAYPKANEHNIYSDLMDEFKRNNHNVYVACSNEKKINEDTFLSMENGVNILRIKTGNITGQVNLIEKGISTITIEKFFICAIKKYFNNIKFDLVIYNTPPITLINVVKYIKKRDGTYTYLLLKDIFPQNAVDISLIKQKSIIYKYFRYKEKQLYEISDYIGCMSPANVDYILKNNHELVQKSQNVEVCPNSIYINEFIDESCILIKDKYNIPKDSIAFIYGGNLGKPQGIDHLINCLCKNIDKEDRFFIICGYGSEYYKLENFCDEYKPNNVLLINGLPKNEYDKLVKNCDIGMIFLDHRFTIPNFPSRLLSYLEYGIPVLACTDKNTDIGKIIQDGKFGWWCESNQSENFCILVDKICQNKEDIKSYGSSGRRYLEDNYNVGLTYNTIINNFSN